MEGNSCLLSGGAPDSPVHHRTSPVHCPVQIAFLNWRSRPLKTWSRWRTGHCPVPPSDRWLGHASRADCTTDFWRSRPLQMREPLAHRTCPVHTGQSGAHRTVRCPFPTVGSATCPAQIARPTVGPADRWLTGQSGAPPDSPVIFSRMPLITSRER